MVLLEENIHPQRIHLQIRFPFSALQFRMAQGLLRRKMANS